MCIRDSGYIQPADLTQALARGARDRGAEIYRNTTVTGISRTASGEWKITSDKGEITCEHVVSATGNFARQTGRMVGLNIPVIPVEHQYIVTEPHDDIKARQAAGLPEMGVLRDSDGRWYMREEAGGLILGPYGLVPRHVMSTARVPILNMSCSRRTSSVWSRISNPPCTACPPLANPV